MDDETKLLEIFKICNQNRIDYNIRKWETIKFFETIFSGLIIAALGAIIAASNYHLLNNFLVVFAVIVIQICACFALYLGYLNLKRESKLLFKEEAAMFKIFHSISVDDNIKKFLWDGEFHRDQRYEVIDEIENLQDYRNYLDKRISIHAFLEIFRDIFFIEILISIFLIIATIIIYLKEISII